MLAEALVKFSRIDHSAVPKSTLDTISLSLLDWTSVGLAGVAEPVSKLVIEHILEDGNGNGSAPVFGLKTRVSPRSAALANGTISHALDYDDTHFAHIGHLSTVVLSALMALAQGNTTTIKELKVAAAVGFESACRIGLWLGRSHYKAGFHQTGTAGALGATLACARLIGLDEAQTLASLGLSTSRASGLKSQFGTMGKPLNAGFAAAAAVEAVQLAALGATSAADPLEGQNGFGVTHAAEENHEEALDGLGSRFLTDDNQYKFHACCHGLHGALEALLKIEPKPKAEAVCEILIKTNSQWMSVCDIKRPRTGLEAKFSYRMVVALTLLGFDTARLDVYSDQICEDPDLLDLIAKVKVEPDDSVPELGGEVELKTENGGSVSSSCNLMEPLPFEQKADRLINKSVGLIGEEKARALWQICHGSDHESVNLFLDALSP